jgi:hypothetical protein
VRGRFFENEADLVQMLELLREARRESDDWRYPHIGDLVFRFCMIACHLDPQEHIRLWQAGGRLVGYAILAEDPLFDVQVLPDYAWEGIEQEALEWAERRVDALRKVDPQRWGGPLVSGSRQDDPRRMAFLEEHSFRPGGQFSEVNMLCDLDGPIPEVARPPG